MVFCFYFFVLSVVFLFLLFSFLLCWFGFSSWLSWLKVFSFVYAFKKNDFPYLLWCFFFFNLLTLHFIISFLLLTLGFACSFFSNSLEDRLVWSFEILLVSEWMSVSPQRFDKVVYSFSFGLTYFPSLMSSLTYWFLTSILFSLHFLIFFLFFLL